MGTAKLNIFIISVFLVVFASERNLIADAGDQAKEWVQANARPLSEKFCRNRITKTFDQLFLKSHSQVHATQSEIRKLRTAILELQEETTTNPFMMARSSIENLYQILEIQKNTLKRYDEAYVYLQKLLFILDALHRSQKHLLALSNQETIAHLFQRPTLPSSSFIKGIDIFDGFNIHYDSNLFKLIYKEGEALYKSIKNIKRNKKIYKKLQEAKDLWNSLQVSQDEFKEMAWQDFSLRKTPYEASLKDAQALVDNEVKRAQNFLQKVLEYFSYLDSLREGMIKTHHTQEADAKLAELKKKWHVQDMRLSLQNFKGHLNVLKFKAALKDSKSNFEGLFLMVKLAEENLKSYEKLFGVSQ